jgi:hypothetical protein
MLLANSAQNVAQRNQNHKVLGHVQSVVRKSQVNSAQNAALKNQKMLVAGHANAAQ